jgi:hypothetical protein
MNDWGIEGSQTLKRIIMSCPTSMLYLPMTDERPRFLGFLSPALDGAGAAWRHPHRFRHTFAIAELVAGTPIDQVSVLLGHSSIKVTEKHYAPWVKARQDQMDASVIHSWEEDPLIVQQRPPQTNVSGWYVGLWPSCTVTHLPSHTSIVSSLTGTEWSKPNQSSGFDPVSRAAFSKPTLILRAILASFPGRAKPVPGWWATIEEGWKTEHQSARPVMPEMPL